LDFVVIPSQIASASCSFVLTDSAVPASAASFHAARSTRVTWTYKIPPLSSSRRQSTSLKTGFHVILGRGRAWLPASDRAHHLVVPGVARSTAGAATASPRGAAHLSECQAVQASRAASGSSPNHGKCLGVRQLRCRRHRVGPCVHAQDRRCGCRGRTGRPVPVPDQLCDAQQAHCLKDVEADPGSGNAALAGMPVQLLDQHPDPRHEQDATDSEHPVFHRRPKSRPARPGRPPPRTAEQDIANSALAASGAAP
jgi:hypothetical protein